MELQVMILDDEYIILDGLCRFHGAIMDTVYLQLQGTDWKGWRNWSRRNRI